MCESASTQFEPPGLRLGWVSLCRGRSATPGHLPSFGGGEGGPGWGTGALDLLAGGSHGLQRSRAACSSALRPAQLGRAELCFPKGRPGGWVSSGQGAGASRAVWLVLFSPKRSLLARGLVPGSGRQLLPPDQLRGSPLGSRVPPP